MRLLFVLCPSCAVFDFLKQEAATILSPMQTNSSPENANSDAVVGNVEQAVVFKSYDGPASLSPIPLTVSSPAIRPEDKRLITANALETAHYQAEQQIDILRKQAELLMEQAKAIQMRVEVSRKIYEADLNFQPVIHETYYVYRRNSGSLFISMISNGEFTKRHDLQYLHKVRLLPDKTWEVLDSALEDEASSFDI